MWALERGMPAGDPDCSDSLKWIGMDWIWIAGARWPTLRRESSITWQSDRDRPIENGLNLDCWVWVGTGDITHVRTLVDIWFNCFDNWWEFPLGLPRSPGATTPSVAGIRSRAAFPPRPTLHLSVQWILSTLTYLTPYLREQCYVCNITTQHALSGWRTLAIPKVCLTYPRFQIPFVCTLDPCQTQLLNLHTVEWYTITYAMSIDILEVYKSKNSLHAHFTLKSIHSFFIWCKTNKILT